MSKVANQGMHLAKEAQGLTERMADGIYTAPAPQGGVQGGAQAVAFQRKFEARDRMDDEMNTKMQLMNKEGMTPFGQVFYDDKVGRWLERKAAVAEAANFDAYFGREFNKNDLASRQWAQKINPDWYASRERDMNDRAQMVLKIKGIQLRGPQSKEDLYIQWLIESGRVVLPADWDRIAPGVTEGRLSDDVVARNKRNYFRGLIRMPLFLTSIQRESRAALNKGRNLWGDRDQARNVFTEGENPPRVLRRQNEPLAQPTEDEPTLAMGMVQNLRRAQ